MKSLEGGLKKSPGETRKVFKYVMPLVAAAAIVGYVVKSRCISEQPVVQRELCLSSNDIRKNTNLNLFSTEGVGGYEFKLIKDTPNSLDKKVHIRITCNGGSTHIKSLRLPSFGETWIIAVHEERKKISITRNRSKPEEVNVTIKVESI
jgi:hypothetical protein